jgi:tRNA A-37 threonylcarbamoyl transferase component Bud32
LIWINFITIRFFRAKIKTMTVQKIGRYEIKSELGRGGMATVYKAYDPLFEREVALKVLPREMLHDPQFRVRFEREAKTIAALEHQAIVPVYDVGEEDGQPYFVMRYMTGGSLSDTIAKGPMSLVAAAKLIERLAPALDDAHLKGIVHRDLKPGNILFDRTGDPYVSDFGIAKITQSQTATVTGGAIIGTPAYMSPEQAQGEKVDGRSDVYAMGVILYEMLSGTQPYQATTPMAIVVKQITDPIPHILDANPGLPSAIETVIEKAMAKSPDERFSSAGELQAALSAVASGQSAEEALKTASFTATRIAAAKTRMMAGKTQVAESKAAEPKKFNIAIPIFIVGGLAVVCVLAVVMMGVLGVGPNILGWPISGPTTTEVVTVLTDTPAPPPATDRPVIVASPTLEITPTQSITEVPATPTKTPPVAATGIIGGADKVAFVANNEIWVMKMDGSDLKVLTNDKASKSDLQWIPGTDTVVFISGTNVNTIEEATGRFDTIASFPFAAFLEVFRISPDGKQVAISLNREMYIVPFDIAKLKTVRGRDGLIAMKGCLGYTGSTQAAIHLKEFRWGADGKTVAWMFEGTGASGKATDMIRIVDISTCNPQKLTKLDEFPGTRFTPEGYEGNPALPDFDWDGKLLFLFNTLHRNDGWGFLYTYDHDTRKGYQENPIASTNSRCCYRDARWSPDGNYIFFAFQSKDKVKAPIQFYYIPISSIRAGANLAPIPLPDDFFKDPKEAPQPALHPATP